ncbi:ferredoxin reductase family protein [Microbacterium oryzae]|uniref:ferredoxin reductase family protein n=1 Tax=Microbacterium oryzae TaxID=743009 RepID=UPI0025B1019C|nr:ferredoxin reductase family protein [Microbacterium oryzae]MDN3310624.1 ferredoxin reductase family protein [Microbacterium oryzae]
MTATATPSAPITGAPHHASAEASRRRFAARRAARADLLSALCVTSVAAAIALWLAYGGPADVGSPAGVLTAAGIIAGLVGTDLVLVMLILAARVPVVDRTFGRDATMALHRRLGKPVLYLLLAHGALLTLGYGASDGLDPLHETLALLSIGDMVFAFVGMALFLAVVVSSLVAVRRRFPYEVWHAIHLLSYAAVLFALPHQLSVGGILAQGTWERVYWVELYVAAFAALAWYRFLLPTVASLRHGLRVAEIESVGPGVVAIHLTGRDLSRLGIAGGQYAIWRFWSRRTWWHAHPISFSSVGDDRTVRVTVRALGAGSADLTRVPIGTRVWLEGPYGIFTGANRTSPHLAVVAAGIGVTPVRSLLEDAALEPGEATVLLRARNEAEQFHWPEVRQLVERKGGLLYGMTGSRARGVDSWMSAEDLARGVTLQSVFPDLRSSDLFVCGPQVWTDLVVRDARAAGVPESQIHVERFDW